MLGSGSLAKPIDEEPLDSFVVELRVLATQSLAHHRLARCVEVEGQAQPLGGCFASGGIHPRILPHPFGDPLRPKLRRICGEEDFTLDIPPAGAAQSEGRKEIGDWLTEIDRLRIELQSPPRIARRAAMLHSAARSDAASKSRRCLR